mgnify:CR=1 FL=1|jgi:hypothetical protein
MREGEDEGENPIHDMPWHVATLYEDWAQYIVHLHFIFFGRGLIYHAHSKSVIARKRPVRRGNLYHPLCHSEESGVFTGHYKHLIHFDSTIP